MNELIQQTLFKVNQNRKALGSASYGRDFNTSVHKLSFRPIAYTSQKYKTPKAAMASNSDSFNFKQAVFSTMIAPTSTKEILTLQRPNT
jgi:hypothetical protein